MKKVFALCSIMILSLFAVGCEKTIELTDAESQMVAEYAADLLLKYDKNLSFKYYDDDEFESPHDFNTPSTEELSTEATTTEEPSTEDISTEGTTTEEPSTEGTTEGTEDSTEDISSGDGNMDNATEEDLDADYMYTEFDLAEFIGQDNIKISYQYAQITESYPSYNNEGMYIEVEAPDGYKLLVLKFRIENLTNEPQLVDLYSKDIDYHIIVNNKKVAKQMLTILMDDMYTYNKTLEASLIDDTVLLFMVSDSVAEELEDMKLKVGVNGKEVIIQLK